MAEFKLTPPVDQNGMGSVYGAPSWLQSALMGAAPQQGPQFPDAPPSYGDREAARTIEAWKNIGNAVKNDPGSVVQMLGMPGFVVGAAAKNASDERIKGQAPLGSPPKRPEAAPTVDLLPKLLDQKTQLQSAIDNASAEVDAQKQTGRGPKYEAALKRANDLIAQMPALNTQISDAQAANKRQAFANDPKTIEAEQVRNQMLANRTKPFREVAPDWVLNTMPWGPAVVAGTVHAVQSGLGAIENRTTAGKWINAIELANKASKANKGNNFERNAEISAGYAKDYPKPGVLGTASPYAIAAGAGALEGGAVANSPEMYDWWRQPDLNPERAAYEEYLKRLPADHPERARVQDMINMMPQGNPLKEAARAHFLNGGVWGRLGTGAYEGAAGALAGKSLISAGAAAIGPSFPRPEAAALAKELKAYKAEKAAAQAGKKSVAEALVEPPAAVPEISGPMPGVPMLPPPSGGPMPKIRPGQDDWGLTNQLYQDILRRYGKID